MAARHHSDPDSGFGEACRAPLRIAMIGYTHYQTDPRCRREARLASANGWEVHFYALARDGRARTQTIDGIALHELPLDRYRGRRSREYLLSYLRFLFLSASAVFRAHRRHRFAVVHVNTMPDAMVLAALAPRLAGAKVLLDIHDVMPEIYMSKFGLSAGHWKVRLIRSVEVLCARLAHAVLTAEHPKAELLIAHGIPREKIAVLLNLPDSTIFPAEPVSPLSSGKGIGSDPAAEFRLMYHGTIALRLGLDQAVAAVGLLARQIPGLRLQILGEGDQLPDLRRQAEQLCIQDRIEFQEGLRPIEEIVPLLRAAHLAVLPTRRETSTDYMLPTKLLEYLILGVPVLCTATRTVKYYFGEDHPLLLEDPSPEALAAKISWVRNEYSEALRLTSELQGRFFGRYGWERHRQVYLDLLDRLIGR